jgi:hypothetical protein
MRLLEERVSRIREMRQWGHEGRRIGHPLRPEEFENTVLSCMYRDREAGKLKLQAYKKTPEYKAKQAEYSAEKRKTEAWKKRTRFNARASRALLRSEVIAAYGGKCSCPGCDIVDPRFLTLDHKDNDGAEHRKQLKAGSAVYLWAKRNGYPNSLRLLCWNCNCARQTNGGVCPHLIKIWLYR